MASINEKLNYINETKSLIKDKLNDLGSEITNETTFREYAEKIEDLYEEWPKISEQGEKISLNNTKKGRIKCILEGNTTQFTTTGKNIFNKVDYTTIDTRANQSPSATTKTADSISFTSNAENNYSGIYITVANLENYIDNFSSDTTYYVSADITTNKACTMYYGTASNSEQLQIGTQRLVKSGTLSSNFVFYVRATEANIKIENIMVSTSDDTSYEPYTGGIASPNPDYPQDIKTTSNNNKILICNKNLCDEIFESGNINDNGQETTSSTTYRSTNYYKVASGQTLICSYNATTNTNLNWCACYDDNKTFLRRLTSLKTNPFTIGDDTVYIRIGFYKSSGITRNDFSNVKLEYGNVSTQYESHQSQIYFINLGNIELCKIDNYQDYLYKNNNKWYKKPVILKIINYNGETISTNYKSTTGNLTTGATVYYVNPESNPSGIEITDTTLINQLNALEQAMSYNNQTNILQENDNLPFIINATALMKNSD